MLWYSRGALVDEKAFKVTRYEYEKRGLVTISYIQAGRLFPFALLLVFVIIILFVVRRAMKGMPIEIRKVAGFEAIPEAIGRAVEMGRPVLYSAGEEFMLRVPERAAAALAGYTILGYIAELACKYKAHLITAVCIPEQFPIADEVVRQKYVQMGVPEGTRDVRFISQQQFAYAAGMLGIIQREKVGASFLIGAFGAEALMLVEAGAAAGAMQIGGEAGAVFQITTFTVACDYVIIGEEVYAAAASVSKSQEELGGITSQSILKTIMIAAILLGALLATFGSTVLSDLLKM